MPEQPRAEASETAMPGRKPDGLVAAIVDKRNGIREKKRINLIYRCVVGAVGAIVLVCGFALIPYPGPGWLIVFTGLGILASEFEWAHRLLTFARGTYDKWMDWVKEQHWGIQALLTVLTFAVVITTLWVVGALALAADWVGIDWLWLASPVF